MWRRDRRRADSLDDYSVLQISGILYDLSLVMISLHKIINKIHEIPEQTILWGVSNAPLLWS
jgi:hypothetical protein